MDSGQTEAARSLGLSQWQAMKLVVLPQAVKNVLPALANEVVTMVKESSVCSAYGMGELMFAAKECLRHYVDFGRPLRIYCIDLLLHQFPRQQGHRGH